MRPTQALAEFIQTFDASLDPRLWIKLMKEETQEFKDAHKIMLAPASEQASITDNTADCLKEAADVMYVTTAFHMLMEHGEQLYQFIVSPEEWSDWQLTAVEANNAMKVAAAIFGANLLGQAFERVHQSNMSKVGDDGKPIRRADGKILKGPNYKPPMLTDLLS